MTGGRIAALLAAVASFAIGHANAQSAPDDHGFSLRAGYSHIDFDDWGADDPDGHALQVYAGYSFNRWLSAELGWFDASRVSGEVIEAPITILPDMRSAAEITGYSIEASDGKLGELEDLLFDEDDWTIRFLVVDTRKWLPGKQVVVPIDRVDKVSWSERGVFLDLTEEQVRDSPRYDPTAELTAESEAGLYAHYRRSPQHHAGLR